MRSIVLAFSIWMVVASMTGEKTCFAQATDWTHRMRNQTDATVNFDVQRQPSGGIRNYYLQPGQIGSGTLRTNRITVYAVYLGPNGTQFMVKSFDRLREDGTIHLNAVLVNGKLDIRRGRF